MAAAASAPVPEGAPQLLRAVFGATFFVRFAFGLTVSVFAAYLAGHSTGLVGSQVGLVGLVTAASPIGELSTVLLSGLHADRYGRGPVLLAGTGAALALFLALSFTRNPPALGLGNLLFGVASGAILAASLAAIGDASDRGQRGLEMGRFDAVNLLGWVLGFAVGFALLGSLPNAALPWVFRLGAVLLAGGFLFAYLELRAVREAPRLSSVSLGLLREALLRREVLLVTLPWFTIYLLLGAGFVYLGSAASGVGIPPTELAALIGGGGLLLLLTQPSYGRLADRYGRLRLMIIGTIGFVGVLTSVALIAAYGPLDVLLATTGVSALAALAYGPAALAQLTDLSLRITRGTTMALYSLVVSAGMIVGLAGSATLFATWGVRGIEVFLGAVAVGLTALTLGWVIESRRPSTAPPIRTPVQ
ncbi:MAG TPA: MFS transporter [Thermoplasmata archaeon]|nr:MFS transporter [Thermoplasmata archaeon]